MSETLKILPKEAVRSSQRTEMQIKGGDGATATSTGVLIDLRGDGTENPVISAITVASFLPKDKHEIVMRSVPSCTACNTCTGCGK